MRRRGSFVVLAGPDGCGKSTLAPLIVGHARRSGSPVRHLHWRPGVLPQAGSFVGGSAGDPSAPHALVTHGSLVSLGRLLYYWIDFLVGTWVRILPVRRRGGLVVMERGWWDFLVDPRRYRLRVRPGVMSMLGRLLPPPDLVFLLLAPPETLAERKQELPMEELARQNDAWRGLRLPPRTRRVVLDASRRPQELVHEAAVRIAEHVGTSLRAAARE